MSFRSPLTFCLVLLLLCGTLQCASNGVPRRTSVCLQGTTPPPTLLCGFSFSSNTRVLLRSTFLCFLFVQWMAWSRSFELAFASFLHLRGDEFICRRGFEFQISEVFGRAHSTGLCPGANGCAVHNRGGGRGGVGKPGRLGRRVVWKQEMHRNTS